MAARQRIQRVHLTGYDRSKGRAGKLVKSRTVTVYGMSLPEVMKRIEGTLPTRRSKVAPVAA
jgi:hypothetical protein